MITMLPCLTYIQYPFLKNSVDWLICIFIALLILFNSVSGHELKTLALTETNHLESWHRPESVLQESSDREVDYEFHMPILQLKPTRNMEAYSPHAKGTRFTSVSADTKRAASRDEKPRKQRNLVYASVDGKPLNLDLFIPRGTGPHPLIVWIHGGGWQKGDKKLKPTHPARQQVMRGYAVASIEYRLSQQAKFPSQIQDCKAAIRWLRGNAQRFDLDPNRFAVWGSSAGGHLAALLGTSGDVAKLEDLSMGYADISSRVQAVVDWFGPTDLAKMGGKHNQQTSPESLLIGCPIQTCLEKTAIANPINYISSDDPPFFIQHGTGDKVVPYHQSELLYEALLKKGLRPTFIALEGAKHTDPRFSSPNNVALVEDFLDRVLRN